MIRPCLKNKANKSKNRSDSVKFISDDKTCSKSAKLEYFEKLSVDYNSKPFWKACKPCFSNKTLYTRKYNVA